MIEFSCTVKVCCSSKDVGRALSQYRALLTLSELGETGRPFLKIENDHATIYKSNPINTH